MVRRKKILHPKKQAIRRPKTSSHVVSTSRSAKKVIKKPQKISSSAQSRKLVERIALLPGARAQKIVSQPRKIGTPMHPYMRTMFLSLAVGSAGVFASMLYYIHVAHATEASLFNDTASRVTAETALSSVDGSFTGLIRDLEEQRKDAGGAMPIPPREYLRLHAEQADVDYALLNRIAYCESHWRMVENKKSTAFGYFQILDGTEQLTPQFRDGLRRTDPYANIDMAIFLYKKYGTIPWVESQDCWSPSQ